MTEADSDQEFGANWGASERALDQNDIDNLFGDVSSTAAPQPARKGLELLVGEATVGIERMPMLHIIVDRLAQLMTASIRGFTADNAEVIVDRLRSCRLKDFLDSVPLPAMIAVIKVMPFEGYCLAALDPRLIASAVDVLLGGRRNGSTQIEGRPYTAIERTFVERLMNDVVAHDLKQAFGLACDIDFVFERFETTPSYAAITKLSAAALSFRAEVSMEQRGGHIDFLFPADALEPIRDHLAQEYVGKKRGGDHAWRTHMLSTLSSTPVPLRAVIERRPISSAEVLDWTVGSRLLLDRRHDEPIDLFCRDLLVLRASMAEKSGRLALRVDERRIADDWPEQVDNAAP
jgi:flagellar motor switch protein FliM